MGLIEKRLALKRIECDIRVLTEKDLESLLLIKNLSEVHTERIRLQDEGKACYLGAIINARAVGFVLLSFINKDDVQIYTNGLRCADMIDLLVTEPFRNLGIGTALIEAAENVCKTEGIPFLGLDVNPTDNPKTMQLYKNLGYKVVGDLHLDGVYDSYEDWCVDMIKELEPSRPGESAVTDVPRFKEIDIERSR